MFRNNKFVGYSIAGVEIFGCGNRDGQYSLKNNQFKSNVFADTYGKPTLFFYYCQNEGYQLPNVYIGETNHYWNFFSSDFLRTHEANVGESMYDYTYFKSVATDIYPFHPTAGLFSDASENHIQGIANADFLETKTFPCPNGVCNGWTDETGASVTFPLTLAPRESKVLWHS